MNNRANDAAQRVFDNLADLMRFKQKSQLSIDNISVNDSGIGDENSLDSWRVQAEQAVTAFCLTCYLTLFSINFLNKVK